MKWLSKLLNDVINGTELFKKVSNIESRIVIKKSEIVNMVLVVNRLGDAHASIKAIESQFQCKLTPVSCLEELKSLEVNHYMVSNGGWDNPVVLDILAEIHRKILIG